MIRCHHQPYPAVLDVILIGATDSDLILTLADDQSVLPALPTRFPCHFLSSSPTGVNILLIMSESYVEMPCDAFNTVSDLI